MLRHAFLNRQSRAARDKAAKALAHETGRVDFHVDRMN